MSKSNQNNYNFLTKFIKEEKYLQNSPLETSEFIKYCLIRRIEIDEKELESFEKEKVLFPIFRIDLPITKEETYLINKDGRKYQKHFISYSSYGFGEDYKRILTNWLGEGILYDPSERPFKNWGYFKDEIGRRKIVSFYSSYQIYWLSMLKKAFSLSVDFAGEDVRVVSFLPNIYAFENKAQFFISKNQVKDVYKKVKEKSKEKPYEEHFDIERRRENIGKEYQLFNQFLKFLLSIQNIYYPYARSGSKTIRISGKQETWFKFKKDFKLDNELKYLGLSIDDVAKWYWILADLSQRMLGSSKADWIQLWKNISWDKKEKLEGNARLGVDYLQWAIMLKRVIEEYLDREIPDIDEINNFSANDILEVETNVWDCQRYSLRSIRNARFIDIGLKDEEEFKSIYKKIIKSDLNNIEIEKEIAKFKKMGFYINWPNRTICFNEKKLNIKNYYHDKYKRLFYLINSFNLDYQAKIIVFVEGKTEEQILPKVFQWYFGTTPDNYGIEFINFRGVDQLLSTSKSAEKLRELMIDIQKELKKTVLAEEKKQNLNRIIRKLKEVDIVISNWTSFLSYNLEKWQIIPFFLSDDEGNIKHFLEAEKPIKFNGTNYNIPREWYFLWGEDNQNKPYKGNNFELANFNDNEISAVLSQVLEKKIEEQDIQTLRDDKKGIKAIDPIIDREKILISSKLFEHVFKKYDENKKNSLLERPVFKAIDKIINLALVNHFPIDRRIELENKNYIERILSHSN